MAEHRASAAERSENRRRAVRPPSNQSAPPCPVLPILVFVLKAPCSIPYPSLKRANEKSPEDSRRTTLTELRQPLRKGWHVLTGDGRADAGRMVSLSADLSNMTPPTLLSASRTSPSKASDTLTWIFEGLSSMAAPQRRASPTAAEEAA
jgi:hypothetical protein